MPINWFNSLTLLLKEGGVMALNPELNLLKSNKSSFQCFVGHFIPKDGSWFLLGNITCVMHNTAPKKRGAIEGIRSIEFIKRNGTRTNVEFRRFSSSLFLRCLKQSDIINPFTYKYIPRAIQLDSIVRVKKLKKQQGLSVYELLINGVHWKYCASNGKIHIHAESVDKAVEMVHFYLGTGKKVLFAQARM